MSSRRRNRLMNRTQEAAPRTRATSPLRGGSERLGFDQSFDGAHPDLLTGLTLDNTGSAFNPAAAAWEVGVADPLSLDGSFAHNGATPYPSFRDSAAWNRQLAKQTGEYQCEVPDCRTSSSGRAPSFGTLSDKKRHYRDVHGTDLQGERVEPFYCPHEDCKRHRQGFARRPNLTQHLLNMHDHRDRASAGDTPSVPPDATDPNLAPSIGPAPSDQLVGPAARIDQPAPLIEGMSVHSQACSSTQETSRSSVAQLSTEDQNDQVALYLYGRLLEQTAELEQLARRKKEVQSEAEHLFKSLRDRQHANRQKAVQQTL